MAKSDQGKQQPAFVPGDAESPVKGKPDRTIKDAVRHTDKTEQAQSNQKDG